MLDKLKQLSQLKGLGDDIKKEIVEVEKQGIKVVLKGDFTIEEISLNSQLEISEQEKILKECFNQAIHEIQMKMAKKMMGMGV
jgi:DNA-binding protein YbaB